MTCEQALTNIGYYSQKTNFVLKTESKLCETLFYAIVGNLFNIGKKMLHEGKNSCNTPKFSPITFLIVRICNGEEERNNRLEVRQK